MKTAGKICTGWLLALMLSGCLVVGKNKEYQVLDSDKRSQVVIGTTTAEQVCQLFGAPTEIVELSNGNAYIYRRSVAKATVFSLIILSFANYEKQYDQMVFFFAPNNILTHYGVSLHADEASYGLPH